MCHKKEEGAPIKRGNATRIDPEKDMIPKNLMYSVTRHDKPSPDESNIPIPDTENTALSKKFVDDNHLD
ncbi:MAG TPA: hypothetical protein DF364_04190 [Ruminococcaceae bacterium]|nr:hypothetical protein [Oscillospiraceae bacterium]